MQNENIENLNSNPNQNSQNSKVNQAGIKSNPSRNNVNQGQQKFDAQNEDNRDVEIDSAGFDSDEIDLDRSGISTSPSRSNDGLTDEDVGTTKNFQGNANLKTQQSGQEVGKSGAMNQQQNNKFNQQQDDLKRQ